VFSTLELHARLGPSRKSTALGRADVLGPLAAAAAALGRAVAPQQPLLLGQECPECAYSSFFRVNALMAFSPRVSLFWT
jgi:hypothetical protein